MAMRAVSPTLCGFALLLTVLGNSAHGLTFKAKETAQVTHQSGSSSWLAAMAQLLSWKGSERKTVGANMVNVFIGTAGHGHVFPGAATPFGMAVATPWTHSHDAGDSQAGFDGNVQHGDLHFHGMAHSALSGAGTGELGELRLLPLPEGATPDSVFLNRSSAHGSPGYFSGEAVAIEGDATVVMESTVTPRGAFHRFTFPVGMRRRLAFDLKGAPGVFWGLRLEDFQLSVGEDNESLDGCALSRVYGFGDSVAHLCFALRFTQKFDLIQTAKDKSSGELSFPMSPNSLEVRVGLSRVSLHHAQSTIKRELDSSFDETLESAKQLWFDALGGLHATFLSDNDSTQFYSALYHSMLFPSLASEVDGKFRIQKASAPHQGSMSLADLDIKMPTRTAPTGTRMFTTFSLWDTYRTTHPLLNLVAPRISKELGYSLLEMKRVWGPGTPLPWQLLGSPSDMMEGDAATIVLVNMAQSGILDAVSVLDAVSHSSRDSGRGRASAATENARADMCVSRLALSAGRPELSNMFRNSAFESLDKYWIRDRSSGAIVPAQHVSENAINPSNQFMEGTPLQYGWAIEWILGDPEMLDMVGGKDAVLQRLDYYFNMAPTPHGSDVNVDEFMHGHAFSNEVAMHVPYIYSLLGCPAGTARVLNQGIPSRFSNSASGIPGNDDLGAMSSWLVLSMLGLYPADVCSGSLVLGRPFVKSASLTLGGDSVLNIDVDGQGEGDLYVSNATWNNDPIDLSNPHLSLSMIAGGGNLHITLAAPDMDSTPSPDRCYPRLQKQSQVASGEHSSAARAVLG